MSFLIAISSRFYAQEMLNRTDIEIKPAMSPIVTNFNELRDSFFFVDEFNETLQVIGHSPNGFASTLGVYNDLLNKHGWLLNVDTTMSYQHTPLNAKPNEVYNYISINSNHNIISVGNIVVNDIKNIPMDKKDIGMNEIYSNTNNIKIYQEVNDTLGGQIKKLSNNIDIHQLGNTNVIVKRGNGFEKTLLVLSNDDLQSLSL